MVRAPDADSPSSDEPATPPPVRLTAALGVSLFLLMLPVTMMVPVLKELLMDRYGASRFWTHSFMSINMIAAVLTVPFLAAYGDRLRRRKPMLIVAMIANAVLLGIMPYVPSLSALLVVRFVEGAVHILAISTIMALAGDWSSRAQRGRMMGLIGSALIFGTACGAPLGGRLGQHAPLMVFQLGAVFALLAAVVTALAVRDAPMRKTSARMREALSLLRDHPRLMVPYAYAFIDRFCVGVIVSSFVLFLGEIHGFSPAQRGGLLALFLFPFALLCYPIGRLSDRFGRLAPMCVGSLLFGIVYASYGVLPVSWLPAAMLASGILSAIMFAPNLALCAELSPANKRASAYAGFNIAGSLGFMCGPLIGGAVMSWTASRYSPLVAYQTAFVVAGATEVLCALISLPWLIRLHREMRAEAPQREKYQPSTTVPSTTL